jgi:4-amino-4-deoxychorismate lyase
MILVDGVANAGLSAKDRGLAYGDGVFRTFVAQRGVARQWRRHYAKLARDCAAIGIDAPAEPLLADEVRRVAEADEACVVKIIVTRGVGTRGYAYGAEVEATRVVASSPLPQYPQTHGAEGVRIRRCRLRVGHQPVLAGVKHLNRLENVLARAESNDPDIAEGLLCDAANNVIGGTMTNLFIARRGTLATPALTRCGVAGVTRERVIEAAGRAGLACDITDLGWDQVAQADEVILVNSVAGAWPVREIDGAARAVGPFARTIQDWLEHDDA